MTFNERVTATVQTVMLPGVVDTVLESNVLTLRVLGNAKPWPSSETVKKSIQVSAPTNGGSFSGMDTFDTSLQNTKKTIEFDVRGYYYSVVVSGIEKALNANDENRVVELLANGMEEAANAMSDDIGDIFYGDGTGNSSKDFLGVDAIVDDGGEVATYGGLSRATYTTLKANETDVGGALTLDAMATMYSSCKVGSDKPTLIVTTESIWDDYEAFHTPTMSNNRDAYKQVSMRGRAQMVEAMKGDIGFDALAFRGVPVVADEKCDSGKMFFLNEKHLSFYSLPDPELTKINTGGNKTIEGYYGDEPSKSLGFMWTGLKKSVNQYGEIGQILLLGNLVSFDPRKHGVLNTIS